MLDPVTTCDERTAGWMTTSYQLLLGLDVGKDAHHAVGTDPASRRLHDAPLPNSEPKLRALFDNSPRMACCWWWSINRPRSTPCRLQSPARIRGLLTRIHPALEHAIGPKISHPAVLESCLAAAVRAGLHKAGRRKLTAIATTRTKDGRQARYSDHDGTGRTDRHRPGASPQRTPCRPASRTT